MSFCVAHLWAFFGQRSERCLTEEILGLQQHGVETDILSFRQPDRTLANPKDELLRPYVRYLEPRENPFVNALRSVPQVVLRPWAITRGHAVFPKQGFGRFGERLRGAYLTARLARALTAQRPDVLHAQHGHIGWLALPVAARFGIPLVVSLRGKDVSLLRELADGRLGEFGDVPSRFLTRCECMAREAREMGVPADRLFVHPSGVSVQEIPFRERPPAPIDRPVAILSVGRLVEKKGMADTISALAASKTASHRAILRIVGAGPEEAQLRKLARQRGVNVRVRFIGWIPHKKVLEEMSRADIFILSSHATADGDREGIPNVIKEAASSGLPIVSTTHSGIPEVVKHGETGLLADEGSVEGLANCLDEMLKLSNEWAAMGRRAREIIEKGHDVTQLTPRLVEHYQAVMAEASSG